jgi:hypothetical protein
VDAVARRHNVTIMQLMRDIDLRVTHLETMIEAKSILLKSIPLDVHAASCFIGNIGRTRRLPGIAGARGSRTTRQRNPDRRHCIPNPTTSIRFHDHLLSRERSITLRAQRNPTSL